MFQRKSLLGLLDHEYVGTMTLLYVSSCVPVDKACPRQLESSATLLREPQVSYCELILLLVTVPHMGVGGERKRTAHTMSVLQDDTLAVMRFSKTWKIKRKAQNSY